MRSGWLILVLPSAALVDSVRVWRTQRGGHYNSPHTLQLRFHVVTVKFLALTEQLKDENTLLAVSLLFFP